jgi:hypothetical protein
MRWIALNDVLKCGDYIDEVYFYNHDPPGSAHPGSAHPLHTAAHPLHTAARQIHEVSARSALSSCTATHPL